MNFPRNIHNRLGNKTTPIVFVLVPIIIFVFIFFGFSRRQTSRTQEIKTIAAETQNRPRDLALDSDQDGLKDWEEEIYHTGPNNPDTDGDGTNDGDEIALGRDPRKPGPNDVQTKKSAHVASTPSLSSSPETQNITRELAEVFGKDFLVQQLKNPNAKINPDALANKMAYLAVAQAPSHIKPFTRNDIIITRDTSKAAIEHYLKTFDQALLSAFKTLTKKNNAVTAFKEALEQDNVTRLNDINPTIHAYDSFLVSLKTIPVPEDFIALHLSYLTTTAREQAAIKKLLSANTDIVFAAVGLREILETTKEFESIRKQYQELYTSKGIIAKATNQ